MAQVKTSVESDPITGEWYGNIARLEAMGRPYMVLPGYDNVPQRQRDWSPHFPTQMTLGKSQGHLGGRVLTPAMWRYMRVKDDDQPARHATPSTAFLDRNWWLVEGAERDMRANWPSDIVDVILAVRRDRTDWPRAMEMTQRPIKEVKVAMRKMAHHFREQIRQQMAPMEAAA